MPGANSLVGDVLYASDSPDDARPFPIEGRGTTAPLHTSDANRVANYVAFFVLFALATLILIRIAGLQGMIAVGRAS
jgi:hypothetical protein